jgi:hypothetical protein
MLQSLLDVLAGDLTFQCFDPMKEHLKSTNKFTVIGFNSFHSFQKLCNRVASGVDAAAGRNRF